MVPRQALVLFIEASLNTSAVRRESELMERSIQRLLLAATRYLFSFRLSRQDGRKKCDNRKTDGFGANIDKSKSVEARCSSRSIYRPEGVNSCIVESFMLFFLLCNQLAPASTDSSTRTFHFQDCRSFQVTKKHRLLRRCIRSFVPAASIRPCLPH